MKTIVILAMLLLGGGLFASGQSESDKRALPPVWKWVTVSKTKELMSTKTFTGEDAPQKLKAYEASLRPNDPYPATNGASGTYRQTISYSTETVTRKVGKKVVLITLFTYKNTVVEEYRLASNPDQDMYPSGEAGVKG